MSDKKEAKTSNRVVTAHPSSLKHSNANVTEQSGIWSKIWRNWPITVATTLSVIWISFCGYYLFNAGIDIAQIPALEVAALVTGMSMPLVLIWLLCLVLIRLNPIEENYRSLEKGLDQLMSRVELTQERIVKVVKNLNSEIEKITAAGDVATNRFKNLEDSFKEQIDQLFKATIDADEKSKKITDQLSFERNAISSIVNEIEKHSELISKQLKEYRKDAIDANDETKRHSEFLNNEMSYQNKVLDNRAKQIEESLASIGERLLKISDEITDQSNHSYHHLSEIVDGFDERRAVLNNFMTRMMDEVGSICDKLEKQAHTVHDLSDKSAKTSAKITSDIKKQSEQLSKIADKSTKSVEATGRVIEEQTKTLGSSIEEATERSKLTIAEASDYFAERANDISRVSGNLESNIKKSFDEITDTLAEKTSNLSEDITIQFQNVEADIDRANAALSDMIENNLELLSSRISSNKEETGDLLKDIVRTITSQTEQIEKSLKDTRINMIDRTTLIQDEHQALENYATDFQKRMIETENKLREQHQTMVSCISVIEDGMTVAIDKIKKNSTSLGAHGQKVIESIISQTSELTAQIAEVQNRSKNSILEIENASKKANNNLLANESKTTEIISDWLEAASQVGQDHALAMRKIEKLMSELSALEKTTEKTLSASEEKIRRISSELLRNTDSIQIASNSAVEAAEETNRALTTNAEKYQQMINAIQLSSQSLANNANALERRMKRINSENFSKVAAAIMEKLRSQAIDISSYLEGNIPKSLWDSYLSGDKNLFIRKIQKYVGRQEINDIRLNYTENSEFRKNVDTYIQIFEELLATFNESTETVYCETLVTSDIGKVYFALAEATGRLK